MPQIAVVDYGMGNLRSVTQALRQVADSHTEIVLTDQASVIAAADKVVFPGQGAMPDCMRELNDRGLRDAITEAAASKPFLGICVGAQLLLEFSEEGNTAGLGVFAGQVKRFPANQVDEQGLRLKIPHMGWNRVQQQQAHPLWQGINNGERFYFVHSYYLDPADTDLNVGQSEYPTPFTAVLGRANIFATQFHPEKSHRAGLQLLQNFIHWNGSV
jgi:glutamine amidotransferase